MFSCCLPSQSDLTGSRNAKECSLFLYHKIFLVSVLTFSRLVVGRKCKWKFTKLFYIEKKSYFIPCFAGGVCEGGKEGEQRSDLLLLWAVKHGRGMERSFTLFNYEIYYF